MQSGDRCCCHLSDLLTAPEIQVRHCMDQDIAAEMAGPRNGMPETDVWKTKPPWCQPWTIVSSGIALVAGLLHEALPALLQGMLT